MQPLSSVKVELMGEDASGFGACFRDDYSRGVITKGQKRCDTCNPGCVRGGCATHDDGEDAHLSTGPWSLLSFSFPSLFPFPRVHVVLLVRQ
jgi:hypothetical protein